MWGKLSSKSLPGFLSQITGTLSPLRSNNTCTESHSYARNIPRTLRTVGVSKAVAEFSIQMITCLYVSNYCFYCVASIALLLWVQSGQIIAEQNIAYEKCLGCFIFFTAMFHHFILISSSGHNSLMLPP